MNKATEIDLSDAADAIEAIGKRFSKLSLEAKIDVAARLKGVAKTCKTIDETVKDEVKSKRRGREGYVLGELFKAYLAIFPVTRLDQEKLELEYPDIHAACKKTKDEGRVTFEVR